MRVYARIFYESIFYREGDYMLCKGCSRDIILILISSFFYMACPMLVTPLITGYSESLGASAAVMGIIGGLTNICSLLCRPLVGNLADKISKYRLSFVGAVLVTAACVGYIAAENSIVVIVSRIVNGVGFACCSVCMSTWMSNMLPKEKIGSGMGLYGAMNALAMAIAPAVGVSVYQKFGYRAALVIAVVFGALTVLVIQFIRDKGEPIQAEREKADRDVRVRPEIVDKKVLPVAVIVMLFAIPYFATQSFLVNYTAQRHLHVTVSLFFPLYAIMLLVQRLSMRNIFDKKPFYFFIALSSASALASIFMLTVMKSNLYIFFAGMFMAGGYGIMCSVCQSKAILLAGEGKRGLANSTYYVGLDLGMALGPVIGGVLYGYFPIEYFYPILAVTVPLIILVYWLNRRRL